MRTLLLIILSSLFLAAGTGQAAALRLHSFPEAPSPPVVQLSVRLTGSDLFTVQIIDHESVIEIRIHGKNGPAAGLLRPKAGKYTFCQVQLRDKCREELVGIGLTGPPYELTDIFIIGLDNNNEIAPLDLVKDCARRFVAPKLELSGQKLSLPLLFAANEKLTISWDRRRQLFVLTDH